MKITLVFLFIVIGSNCFSQYPIPCLAQPRADSFYYFFEQLRNLRKHSRLIICYRRYVYWREPANWEIISVSDNDSLRKFSTDPELEILKPEKISPDSLASQLKIFYDNDIFSIREYGWGCDTLDGHMIYEAPGFDFLLITKKQIMQLNYVSPTPCDDERRRIVKIIEAFWRY